MKRKVLIITNLILAVMLALFAVGYTYAWFAEYYKTDIKLYADHDQAYFASGDGKSESTAYEINSYRHLYNLAWLQNTGKISDGTYFKISANIKMSQGGTYFVIPPIGNDKYPFNSIIDGGGCTISNLIVSTDKNKLTNFPNEKASSYAFSNYVGLFGNTGTSSSISNFILDNPIVEVADDSTANTLYSTSGSESCVGLAIGYVNGSASSIGVIGGILAVQKTGYVTYNSILGTIDEKISTSVTGGNITQGSSGTSGTGTSFGGSVSMYDLIYRMSYMSEASWTSPVLTFNGLENTSSPSFIGDAEESDNSSDYMSLIVDESTMNQDWYTENATSMKERVASNNIGYLTGRYDGKNAEIAIKKTADRIAFSVCYANNSDKAITSEADFKVAISDKSITDVDIYQVTGNGVKEKATVTSEVKSSVLELINNEYVYAMKFECQGGLNGWVTIEDATVAGKNYDKINLPPSALWFVPQESGLAKIIFLTWNDTDRGVTLYHITRSQRDEDNYYYTSEVASNNNVSIEIISKVYENSDGTYSYNSTSDSSAICIYDYDWYNNNSLVNDYVYYIEIPVNAGEEYAFAANQSNEGHIIYLDIGQNGTATPSTGKYSTEYEVSAIDFIYSGVTIYGSNFVILEDDADTSTTLVEGTDYNYYVPTETRISFTSTSTGTTAVLIIAYTRESGGTGTIDETSYTIRVTYYIDTNNDTYSIAQSSTGAYIPDSSTSLDSNYFTNYNNMVKSFE